MAAKNLSGKESIKRPAKEKIRKKKPRKLKEPMLNCPMCKQELDVDNQDHALALTFAMKEDSPKMPTGKLLSILAAIAPEAYKETKQ